MFKNYKQESFTPQFCPYEGCLYHFGSHKNFYVKNGFSSTQKPPGLNQKYKCKFCKKGFSENTFSLEFRKKKVGLGEEVLINSMNGMSNNSIAIKLKVSEATIRNRLTLLARQSLLFEKEKHINLQIKEKVAYDGFETFTYDQYSPCYINTAVGSKSMYNYSTTFSPLNRKGRMTNEQKLKLKTLIKLHGRYPTNGISKSSEYVFSLLEKYSVGTLELITDEHLSYKKALKRIRLPSIQHSTIHSSEPRTPSNPLFPINHLHRNYRHFFSSQHRETISFQKHEAGLMEKVQLMKIYKNYMRTKFTRSSNFDPNAGKWSPAMYLNLESKVLEFDEIFKNRRFYSLYKLDEEEVSFYKRRYSFSRRKIALY